MKRTPKKRRTGKKKKQTPGGLGDPDLGAIFALWMAHPEGSVRRQAAEMVANLVAESKPLHPPEAIEEVLRSEKGTLLDPFTLSEAEIEAATAFVSLGLSQAHRQDAVRVVSSSTIGRAGGLVVQADLTTAYISRSLLEGRLRTPWHHWHFAPAELRAERGSGLSTIAGQSGMVGRSFVLIDVRDFAPWYGTTDPEAGVRLREASVLAGVSLVDLGVALDFEDGVRLVASASTPEAIIRCISALGRGRLLRIGDPAQGGPCLLALLETAPPRARVLVPTRTVLTRAPSWLRADLRVTPPRGLVFAAAAVSLAPWPWFESLSQEELVEAFESR